jgi:subtilisin family serine protease
MKKLLVLAFVLCNTIAGSYAQKTAPQNWYNLDQKKDKVPGVSTERAYSELLKDKKSHTVVVAVIDGGTEVDHEDLMEMIWVNTKEIPNNNIDDDQNGYVDDIHGWNFIGGKDGDVKEDNLELARIYRMMSSKMENVGDAQKSTPEYAQYLKVKTEYEEKSQYAKQMTVYLNGLLDGIDKIVKTTQKENPTAEDLKAYKPTDMADAMAQKILIELAKQKVTVAELKAQIQPGIDHYQQEIDFGLNQNLDTRQIVGDHYENLMEKNYGNNHYEGPKGDHGTHVAGIIAATRDNGKGMNGVAKDVKIMVVRVVPDGDERDKDVANGIRYAVDNGAKVINMSFGKSYSPSKSAVDEAVRYAVSKNVLIIHAAGNDGNNIDTSANFPSDTYSNSTVTASSWIEVGASTWKKGKMITADFSNYGKKNVDVFAPGKDIYSTIPGSSYASFDGTSMAAPVTTGVAALVWSYYPELTANQLKEIILQSSVKVKGKVLLPGSGKKKTKVALKDISQTGGIVNAYEAIKLAETTVNKK